MYVCMYIYIYIYISIHTHTHTHSNTCIYTHIEHAFGMRACIRVDGDGGWPLAVAAQTL
jgi:hypothetical protein